MSVKKDQRTRIIYDALRLTRACCEKLVCDIIYQIKSFSVMPRMFLLYREMTLMGCVSVRCDITVLLHVQSCQTYL